MVQGIVFIDAGGPKSWDRIANEKNALVSLSNVNPYSAMEFLPQVDDPSTQTEGALPKMFVPTPPKAYLQRSGANWELKLFLRLRITPGILGKQDSILTAPWATLSSGWSHLQHEEQCIVENDAFAESPRMSQTRKV
jgi:hypothetical protein